MVLTAERTIRIEQIAFEQGGSVVDLKERRIYQLPNGRELVARRLRGQQVILYSLSASDPREYEINPDGRLVLDGQLTAWEVSNLLDTGRSASDELSDLMSDASEERDAIRVSNRA